MTRTLLLILLLPLSGMAQPASIWFDQIVYNFGVIEEDKGQVEHEFRFINRTDSAVLITDVVSSCGCAVAVPKDTWVGANEESSVKVIYDPKDRPGYFVKSIELTFAVGDKVEKRLLNIKGFVATGGTFSDYTQSIRYEMHIKPYQRPIVAVNDTVWEEDVAFINFMNDITYIIDQEGFADINIQLSTIEEAPSGFPIRYDQMIKDRITRGLAKRMYEPFQAGFKTYIDSTALLEGGNLGQFIIYPEKYADEKVRESVFIPIDNPRNEERDSIEVAELHVPFDVPGDLIAFRMLPLEDGKLSKEASTALIHWMDSLSVITRTGQQLIIGPILPADGRLGDPEKIDKRIGKVLQKAQKALVKEGVGESSIIIRPAVFRSYEEGVDHAFIGFFAPMQLITMDTSSITEDTAGYQEISSYPLQNLPVYTEWLHGMGSRIDTTNIEFQRVIELLVSRARQGHPVKIMIESSASRMPTGYQYDNHYVARIRAQESIELIQDYLQTKGQDPAVIEFVESIALISGPEYNLSHFLHTYYQRYQFIRLIPFYETSFDIEQDGSLSPYMINFDYGNAELITHTELFQNFCDQVAETIKKQGFLRMIIESSSSKVPTLEGGNNKILAWKRGEDAREKLMEEIRKRGVDPDKIIFTELRNLVQGPDFRGDSEQNRRMYEKFQYIKFVPEAVIKTD